MVIGGVLLTWLLLYWHADPTTHLGAFYGNAAADWLGSFVEHSLTVVVVLDVDWLDLVVRVH